MHSFTSMRSIPGILKPITPPLRLKKRLSAFHYEVDAKQERRAFWTTAALFLVMCATFLPYSLIYLVSYNGWLRVSPALIHVMSATPYVKMCTDPLVYGVRTLEMRQGSVLLWRRLRWCGRPPPTTSEGGVARFRSRRIGFHSLRNKTQVATSGESKSVEVSLSYTPV